MKRIIYSILLLLAVTVASCKKDEPIIDPEVTIEVAGKPSTEGITLPQDGSLVMKANVEKTNDYTVVWRVNGNEVSTENEFTFVATTLGEHTIVVDVLNHDGGKASAQTKISVYGKYKHGTFILNEGNMTSEQGSLLFISPDGTIGDSVYWHVNGSFLGNSAQDLCIADNKMYVISQNGGGDGMLVVANAETLKKEEGYSKEQMAILSWPTHVAVIGGNAYIRDNKGIYNFDLASKSLTFIEGSKGAAKNRMAVVADKLFVPAGKNIYVIQKGAIIHTIALPGTASAVIKSSDNHLWVSCTTAPAHIIKIKPSDHTIVQTNELPTDANVGAGWGGSPAISAKADTIYFSNATTKIYRHIFNQNKTEYLTDVKEHIQNAGMVYSNLAVHPLTGEVYFCTIKGYGLDYLINNIARFNFSNSTPALTADHKNHTRFPAGVFFTE